MTGFNRVVIAGKLTADPELKQDPQGNAVTVTRIAVERQFLDKQKELRQETTYVDVRFYGKSAETFARYLKKGDPVLCEGRLIPKEWIDGEGKPRAKITIEGERFRFLPRPQEGET